MIAIIEQWSLVVGFLGVVIAMLASFFALPQESKRRYRVWFQISVVLVGIGIMMQLVAISWPS